MPERSDDKHSARTGAEVNELEFGSRARPPAIVAGDDVLINGRRICAGLVAPWRSTPSRRILAMRMSLAFVLLLFVATHAQAQRLYSVFFDWDRATVTDQGYQVIQRAAATARGAPYRVVVDGFTDTSGLTGYNQTLSLLRAQAVAAALERNGVPPSIISIRGFGESHLWVPTPDQVRESQNRRVAIILQAPIVMAPPPQPIPYVVAVPWGVYGGPGLGWYGGPWGGYRGGYGRGGYGGYR